MARDGERCPFCGSNNTVETYDDSHEYMPWWWRLVHRDKRTRCVSFLCVVCGLEFDIPHSELRFG